MKLGVMSDTHGNHLYMQRAADRMVREFGCEVIVHLGDDYADTVSLNANGARLYAVPGMFEPAWEDGKIPHRLIMEFEGTTFLLSHTPTSDFHDHADDINPASARQRYGVDVLLHGHTHIRRAESSDEGLVVVNPGHLKSSNDRGVNASFAVMDVKRPELSVSFIALDGGVIDEVRFTLG